jgi:hypothetical protein
MQVFEEDKSKHKHSTDGLFREAISYDDSFLEATPGAIEDVILRPSKKSSERFFLERSRGDIMSPEKNIQEFHYESPS